MLPSAMWTPQNIANTSVLQPLGYKFVLSHSGLFHLLCECYIYFACTSDGFVLLFGFSFCVFLGHILETLHAIVGTFEV